jgi:hypothetical protein
MRRAAIALVLTLAGCREAPPPAEAVLTLVPTAMRTTGLTAPASNDPNSACLIAGGGVEQTIAVARAPITVIVSAFTPTPATVPSVEIRVGEQLVASDVISTVAPKILAYNVALEPGAHLLRVAMPGNSPGVLCVQSVAVTAR